MKSKERMDIRQKLLASFILAVFTTLVFSSPVGKTALTSALLGIASVLDIVHAGFVSIAANYGIWLICVPFLMLVFFAILDKGNPLDRIFG